MAKYLFQAALTRDGVVGLLADGGTARREVTRQAVEALGGTLEAFYFGFGEHHVVGILDLPDHASAAALALEVESSGRVSVTITGLLTPEEIDRARTLKSGWTPPET